MHSRSIVAALVVGAFMGCSERPDDPNAPAACERLLQKKCERMVACFEEQAAKKPNAILRPGFDVPTVATCLADERTNIKCEKAVVLAPPYYDECLLRLAEDSCEKLAPLLIVPDPYMAEVPLACSPPMAGAAGMSGAAGAAGAAGSSAAGAGGTLPMASAEVTFAGAAGMSGAAGAAGAAGMSGAASAGAPAVPMCPAGWTLVRSFVAEVLHKPEQYAPSKVPPTACMPAIGFDR